MKNAILLLFLPFFLFSQSDPVGPARFDNTWLNGYADICPSPMFGGSTMTFDIYPPKVVRECRDMDFYITNSGFSDQDGRSLAYTNGYYIQNAIGDTMVNGDSINPDYSVYQDVMYQGALFLPQPGNDSMVYLFHEQRSFNINSPSYSTVYLAQYTLMNVFAENGLGRVVKKNVPFLRDTLCYGKLTATKHANGRDWWVIIPKYNQPIYFTYLLTPHGIDTFPPQTIGNPTYSNSGQATFSPDGMTYIKLNSPGYDYGSWLDIFDFDRCTGQLSNYRGFYKSVGGTAGVSVSPNSRYLYFSRGITVHQYDLWTTDVEASEILVAEYDGFNDPLPTTFWMSQLALDGNIYVGSSSTVKSYHIIHHPDNQGLACGFEQHALRLPTLVSKSIPTFPYYRLGPLDGTPCDTLGINNLPIADFRIDGPVDTFGFELVDLSYYNPTAWHWDFGDGTTSTERNPAHTYTAAGIYQVCLIVSNEYVADTICKTIKVGDVVPTIEPTTKGYRFTVAPNPADEAIWLYSITARPQGATFKLFNMTGREVARLNLPDGNNPAPLSVKALPSGVYFYKIQAQGAVVQTGKLLIAHGG